MFKYYIEKYINNMSIDDVYNFSFKNNIELTENEAVLIFNYVKKRWEDILYSNHYVILYEIKNNIRPNVYKKLDELIIFYKEKYKNYLK